MEKNITFEKLESFNSSFHSDRANLVAMDAVVNNGLLRSAKNPAAAANAPHEYSICLEQGEITSQKSSGRCWMFAALNTFRFRIIHDLNLKTFELSQSYPFFYDKLEKSNYFLESIIETLDEPLSGRLVSYLLQAPVNDGGQWDMFCNLIEKYGAVPKSVFPESTISSASRELNSYLTEKLRQDACILREMHQKGGSEAGLREEKERMMEDIYRMLCICLGEPPKSFDFEYTDKDGHYHRDAGLTPKSFYDKYIGYDLSDYVSLINAPTKDKPYGKCYSVSFLGNVKEGRIVRYLNLEIEELKKAAIAQLKDGEPVWFGCDVGKRSERESGIMDPGIYDLEQLLGTSFSMDKAQRLDYGQSVMTHAMVFQGVNLNENDKPDRWRVENSWGKEPGKDGYYLMTDRWFDEYLYQIVVHKKYLSEKQLEAYDAAPSMLEPWDPMGSLAVCG